MTPDAQQHRTITPGKGDISTFLDCEEYSLFFSSEIHGERICKFGAPDRIYLFGKPALCGDLCKRGLCPVGFPS
jgi:hypothetical protein